MNFLFIGVSRVTGRRPSAQASDGRPEPGQARLRRRIILVYRELDAEKFNSNHAGQCVKSFEHQQKIVVENLLTS